MKLLTSLSSLSSLSVVLATGTTVVLNTRLVWDCVKLLTSLSSLSVEVATGTSAKYERLISMRLCEASDFSIFTFSRGSNRNQC